MKVVILAGGLGTRLAEETEIKPKPMVEIGGQPILWHIMKIYAHYGFNDFVIALGYKGEVDQATIFGLLRTLDGEPDDPPWTGRSTGTRGSRGLDRASDRYRAEDTRPAADQAPGPYLGNEHLYAHLRRRRQQRRSQALLGLSPIARTDCHRHRRPPARPLWRPGIRRRPA